VATRRHVVRIDGTLLNAVTSPTQVFLGTDARFKTAVSAANVKDTS
jgi:hypothetical protein